MTAHPYPGSGATTSGSTVPGRNDVTDVTDVSDLTVGHLVAQVTSDISTLMRQEFNLARAELQQEATKAGKGVGLLGGAGFAGYLLLLFASLALMFGLAEAMPLWLAAALVAVLYAVVAAVLKSKGSAALKTVDPTPHQTIDTLKELKETVR